MTELEELADGEYTAVVDTMEDGFATVFFEQDGKDVAHAVVDSSEIPADGQHADAILSVVVEDGALVGATYDAEQTEARREAAQDRFDRLSSRPPSDDES